MINLGLGVLMLALGRLVFWASSLFTGMWSWPGKLVASPLVLIGGAGLGLGLLYLITGRSFDEGDRFLPLWWKVLAGVVILSSVFSTGAFFEVF